MRRLSNIITMSLGAAALLTLVYAKDRTSPTPVFARQLNSWQKDAQFALIRISVPHRPSPEIWPALNGSFKPTTP
jgi:hypothetical protein